MDPEPLVHLCLTQQSIASAFPLDALSLFIMLSTSEMRKLARINEIETQRVVIRSSALVAWDSGKINFYPECMGFPGLVDFPSRLLALRITDKQAIAKEKQCLEIH